MFGRIFRGGAAVAWDTAGAQGLPYRILLPAAQSRPTLTFSMSCVHDQGDQALLSQGPSSSPPSRVQYRCASPLRSTHSVPCVSPSRSDSSRRAAYPCILVIPRIFPPFFFSSTAPDGQYRSVVVDHDAEEKERWKYFRWVNVPCRPPSKLQGPLQGVGRP